MVKITSFLYVEEILAHMTYEFATLLYVSQSIFNWIFILDYASSKLKTPEGTCTFCTLL